MDFDPQDPRTRDELLEALRLSEARYWDLFDRLPDPAWIFEKAGLRFLAVNRAARERYGYSEREFLSMSLPDLRSPEEVPRLLEAIQRSAHLPTIRGEWRHRTASGELLDVEVTAHDLDFQGRACRIAVVRDVTDRMEAWRALETAEEGYRNLVESLDEGVALLDPDARFVFVNPACERIFGARPGELLGRGLREFLDTANQSLLEQRERDQRAGRSSAFDAEIRRDDGERRWISVHSSPRRDAEGVTSGTTTTFLDITPGKRALEALAQSEAKLKAAQRIGHVGSWEMDLEKDTLSWSEECCRIFGRDPATFKPTNDAFFEAVHPEDRERVKQASVDSVSGVRPYTIEHRILLPDGSVRWLHQQAEIRRGSRGRPLSMLGTCQDITERRQALEALEAAEERYRVLGEQTGQLIYDADLERDTTTWTGPMEALLGEAPGTLMDNAGWEARLHPEDRAAVLEELARCTAEQRPFRMQYRFRRKDGSYFQAEDHGIFLPGAQGRAKRMLGSLRDISDRHGAELALRESEERYRSVVEQAGDIIFLVELEAYRVVQANAAFREVLGHPSIEAEPLTLFDLVDSDRASVERNIEVVKAKGHHAVGRRHYRAADGTLRDVEVAATVVRSSGRPLMLVVARDVTEALRAEQALLQSQKLESLGVLAGGIAHDFNNLLTAMMGNLSLAQLKSNPMSPVWPHLDSLEKTLLKAADLTKQMLAYSGRGRFVVKLMDLNHAVEEMTHLLSVSISKKVSLNFDLKAELPAVEADPAQVQQVIMNLVTNAADAIGDQDGTIRIATGLRRLGPEGEAKDAQGQPLRPGRYVCLEVSDTGCGMPPEVLPRIFEPFFTTKSTGRGLGLSAMLGILRGHEAGIQIESSPGQGSTFRLFFPASEAALGTESEHASPVIFQPMGAALVVDDEAEIRQTAVSLFEMLGFRQVLQAADGQEALHIFQSRMDEISLVFMDLTMPRMNGRDAFKAMRELQPKVKVILTSGFNEQDAFRDMHGQAPLAFVQKPYRFKQLRKVVLDAIQG